MGAATHQIGTWLGIGVALGVALGLLVARNQKPAA
jgi:hypothetical protein